MMKIAQNNPFGSVAVPSPLATKYGSEAGTAIGKFIQMGLRTLIVVAGVYSLFNLLFAGFSFMSAGDDPKKVAGAWSKIYQTLLGLAVAAGSFVLAAIFGKLIFDDPLFLLNPVIPEP